MDGANSPVSAINRTSVAVALEAIVRDTLPRSVRDGLDPARALEQFESIRLDSLDRLTLAGKVNAFFGIHETGLEDNLLRSESPSDWIDLAWRSLQRENAFIAFETSGTTGEPKRVRRPLSDLLQEIEELRVIFGSARRIISTVSAKHIYGFLFAALLPQRLGVPRLDARDAGPSFWRTEPASGDLVVSFPDYLQFLADSQVTLPDGVWIVTSTAPSPPSLWTRISAMGDVRMSEVYGSTETGGVGIRHAADEPFRLFSYFSRTDNPTELAHHRPDGIYSHLEVMDEVEWVDDRRLRPVGRRDGAVQVGGVNVYPENIAGTLRAHPAVSDAEVWAEPDTSRLNARVWCSTDIDSTILRRWLAERVATPELPGLIDIVHNQS